MLDDRVWFGEEDAGVFGGGDGFDAGRRKMLGFSKEEGGRRLLVFTLSLWFSQLAKVKKEEE